MRVRYLLWSAALAVVVATSQPARGDAQVKNMTESNRLALARRVEELQQTELFRVSRGRLKASPVLFSLHTIHQVVLQDHDLLINNHTMSYRNALAALEKIFDEYSLPPGERAGSPEAMYFLRELVDSYDIEDELDTAGTIVEVWYAIEGSRFGMESLATRAGLALNARRWACAALKTKQLPADVEAQLELLSHKWERTYNVFELDERTGELSRDYARFFTALAEKRYPQ